MPGPRRGRRRVVALALLEYACLGFIVAVLGALLLLAVASLAVLKALAVKLIIMKALTVEQYKSVLAHKFGRLSHGHGRLSNWIYRLRMSWARLVRGQVPLPARFAHTVKVPHPEGCPARRA